MRLIPAIHVCTGNFNLLFHLIRKRMQGSVGVRGPEHKQTFTGLSFSENGAAVCLCCSPIKADEHEISTSTIINFKNQQSTTDQKV